MTAPARRLRVLLIEDSPSDRELVLAMLEDQLPEAQVVVEETLTAARVRLGENAFDVTLADLSLPDSEGLGVVRAVLAAQPETALIVLTGRSDDRLALAALAGGAQDYLVKGRHDGPRLATALLHAVQRRVVEQAARRYLLLARSLLDALESATCAVTSDGRILAVNEAWRSYGKDNGGDPEGSSEGDSYLKACDDVPGGGADSLCAADAGTGLRDVLSGRAERYQREYPCHSPSEQRWFSLRVAAAEFDGERGAVISHVDVTALHQIQDALAHQALHDALTGLPNRLLLRDRLDQALHDAHRRGREVGLVFLDLDHFKRINDGLGHPAGDDLLVQVARRLESATRESDTLSRHAGDEFVVVLRDLASAAEATSLGERLLAALAPPFDLGGTSASISASVGVVVGGSGQGADELLASADAAMYQAKRTGRGHVRIYTDALRLGVQEELATEAALRNALSRAEFVLHYQPVVELATGRPVGFEALVRWQHPARGLVGPQSFIALAEQTALIVPLGRWVLARACADAMTLPEPWQALDVAVNLSALQLTHPDLLPHVREALQHSGLPAERLILEITESAVMGDEEAAAAAIESLSALGVRIAVDDFGTGYSSLLYLRRFPVSAVKIDRAFVSGIGLNPDDGAICAGVVGLARAVGAVSVGEGVETAEQYAGLRGLGCRFAQGFLWSPGVPLAELPGALDGCGLVPVARASPLHPEGASSLQAIADALNLAVGPDSEGHAWTADAVATRLPA